MQKAAKVVVDLGRKMPTRDLEHRLGAEEEDGCSYLCNRIS